MAHQCLAPWCTATLLLAVGCASGWSDEHQTTSRSLSAASAAEDALNVGYEAEFDALGRVVAKTTRTFAATAAKFAHTSKPDLIAGPAVRADKVQPAVRTLIERARNDHMVDVAVVITPPNRFSPLPRIDESSARDSAVNRDRVAVRMETFERAAAPRREALGRWSETIRRMGGEVLAAYEVGSTIVAKVPARVVDLLADSPDVQYVSSTEGAPPPADGIPGNDAIQARAVIGTDPYVSAGYVGDWGWVGLLDTGVRYSHQMLYNPSPVGFVADCYRGGSTCFDTSDPLYSTADNAGPLLGGHGTSSATIISGNANLGSNWRGVTAQQAVDSWKISADNAGSDQLAVLRALNNVVTQSEWAVAAIIQLGEPPNGPVSTKANDLYDLGVAVFASNGNFSGTTRAPANATKAIGVGGYDVVSGSNYAGSNGTDDGRFKPDLRTPTNFETAGIGSFGNCDNCLHLYDGTSGAAPVAVGIASVLRSFLIQNQFPYAPGNIYSGLIAFGSEIPNSTSGSGRTTLAGPNCSRLSIGQVSVGDAQSVNVFFYLSPGSSDLKAGIWWPEDYGNHRDVDLWVFDPTGSYGAASTTTPSVFEHAQLDGALMAGTWRAEIRGYSVPFGQQNVYYYFYARTC